MKTKLVINDRRHDVEIMPGETLLQTLRERLAMTGTKDGCSTGECGACTVLINGRPRLACVTLSATLDAPIETIEGLINRAPGLQSAFAVEGGFQCGFCTPGQLMACYGIAYGPRRGTEHDPQDLRIQLSGNICRCTGYAGILRALQREIASTVVPTTSQSSADPTTAETRRAPK